jgi:hypothetical protein
MTCNNKKNKANEKTLPKKIIKALKAADSVSGFFISRGFT